MLDRLIKPILSPVAGSPDRVYVDRVPEYKDLPIITFSIEGGRTASTLCGDLMDDDITRVQIDIYTKTAKERAEMSVKLRQAVAESGFTTQLQSVPVNTKQYEAGFFVSTFDYLFF